MIPRVDLVPQFLIQAGLGFAVGAAVLRNPVKRETLRGNFTVLALVATAGILTAPFVALGSAFGAMLAWSWTLGFVLPVLALGMALLPQQPRRKRVALLAVASVGALLSWRAFGVEPHDLEVSKHQVSSPRVEQPLRIAVLADLQTDAPGDDVEAAFAATMAAEPDVIFIAGDVIQLEDRPSYADAWAQLGRLADKHGLAAPLGIFMVQGDADWPDTWEGHAQALGWRVLEPGAAEVQLREDIRLTGLDLLGSASPHPIPRHDDGLHIVLGHRPDFAMGAVDADLLLAGHTHGGQVRLPGIGPLLTFSEVPRAWAAGRTELSSGATLIVSRGIGMERGQAPRIRFLCRPELVVVDVVPSGAGPH